MRGCAVYSSELLLVPVCASCLDEMGPGLALDQQFAQMRLRVPFPTLQSLGGVAQSNLISSPSGYVGQEPAPSGRSRGAASGDVQHLAMCCVSSVSARIM